jgi:hypothetical protein
MQVLFAALLSSLVVAQAGQPSPSPLPSATPVSAKHTLTIVLPNGWVRTESGRYNEWRSPDGGSDFRVSMTAMSPDLRGPGAIDAVRNMVERTTAMINPAAKPSVKLVHVCNGEQTAYRVDDPIGAGSGGFMLLVPGSDSAGIVNYEVHFGSKADPAIQSTIEKLCWP